MNRDRSQFHDLEIREHMSMTPALYICTLNSDLFHTNCDLFHTNHDLHENMTDPTLVIFHTFFTDIKAMPWPAEKK